MDRNERVRLSKWMSFALRHGPAEAGLALDPEGYASVEDVVRAGGRALGFSIQREDVLALAGEPGPGGKRRFEIEGDRIRAGHGHSVEVEGYRPTTPERPLFHATTRAAVTAIRAGGLKAMSRQKVHLSYDRGITLEAARRKGGDAVVVEVDVPAALAGGVTFWESADPRIVLADEVPAQFLRIHE